MTVIKNEEDTIKSNRQATFPIGKRIRWFTEKYDNIPLSVVTIIVVGNLWQMTQIGITKLITITRVLKQARFTPNF